MADKNLHITPHTAGQYHLAKTLDNIVNIAKGNLQALIDGKELKILSILKLDIKNKNSHSL